MLELEVSIGVLAIGLLGLQTLMVRQSRQLSMIEEWCLNDPTFQIISHTDPWMQKLDAPAGLELESAVPPWVPPVTGQRDYQVTLESLTKTIASPVISASVRVSADEDDHGNGQGDGQGHGNGNGNGGR